MRDLFFRLNCQKKKVDISTFSKASKSRSLQPFVEIYEELSRQLQKRHKGNEIPIIPIDATIITLTSKLLWSLGYGEVKLISGLELRTGVLTDNIVTFGKKHDINFCVEMIEAVPDKGIAIMDRGFASLEILRKMKEINRYFIVRINDNYSYQFLEDSELCKIGKNAKAVECRLINFCDLESHKEYRLVTNLPCESNSGFSQAEIAELYRKRWQIELLWKFLKMHLKLDQLITKNVNGISIQIYSTLIAYLILKILEVPKEFGKTLLDKLRYIQACMSQEISFIHWMEKIMRC
jgi:putative transposase